MTQPTAIQAPANAVSNETNNTSANTSLSVPVATTTQANQQPTPEPLLSDDDFKGTTADELDFLDSPSWQSYLSSGEQSEQHVRSSHAGYQSASSVKSQSTPPANLVYQPMPLTNLMSQSTPPVNPVNQPPPPANPVYQPPPPANPVYQSLPPANPVYQPPPPANPVYQPPPPTNSVSQTMPLMSQSVPQANPMSRSSSVTALPPPPFSTPPKLVPVEEVMKDHPGSDVSTLRKLATALAREAIFGKEEMIKSSLSGQNNTGGLNRKKLDYIKAVLKSRVPNMSEVHFEAIWKECRGSLSKSCQTLRTVARKNIFS